MRPEHYTKLNPEPIDVAEAWGLHKDAYLFCVIKYIARYKDKGGKKDLEKALFYLQRRIDIYEQSET